MGPFLALVFSRCTLCASAHAHALFSEVVRVKLATMHERRRYTGPLKETPPRGSRGACSYDHSIHAHCFDGWLHSRCTLEHGHLCVPTPTMVNEDSDMAEVLAKLHTIGLISTDSRGFVRRLCPARRLRAGSRSCNLCGSWRRALGWQGVAGWRLLLCAFLDLHANPFWRLSCDPADSPRGRWGLGEYGFAREAPKSLSTPYGG